MNLFHQSPPQLGNQYTDDRLLKAWLERHIDDHTLAADTGALVELGELAGGDLYRQQMLELDREPTLTRFDPWGQRIDRIELTPLWARAREIAATHGLVARGYDAGLKAEARILQFARVYLFHASSDVYTCPLAMSDGAARALLDSRNQSLIERAVPRLLSTDPARVWTSGQWMTETTGGSDVGGTQTIASEHEGGEYRLSGRKWFTSAATSEMALTLARPQGARPGAKGLALFYLEPHDDQGRLQNIRILRLKHKLGTRKLPTAELSLDGTPAMAVAGLNRGISRIAPMLNVTRTWNAVCAIAAARRGIALARDYANRRIAFGQPLAELPLHHATLADMQSRFEASFCLTFELIRLRGRAEHDQLPNSLQHVLRVMTPIAKLLTARMAVEVVGEAIECFGGAGYVENTGLPALLRDTHVLPIWEGTTNVLALDCLKVLHHSDEGLGPIIDWIAENLSIDVPEPLRSAHSRARTRLVQLRRYQSSDEPDELVAENGARDLALFLGETAALALLVAQADWELKRRHDPRAAFAADRFAAGLSDHMLARAAERDRAIATEIYT